MPHHLIFRHLLSALLCFPICNLWAAISYKSRTCIPFLRSLSIVLRFLLMGCLECFLRLYANGQCQSRPLIICSNPVRRLKIRPLSCSWVSRQDVPEAILVHPIAMYLYRFIPLPYTVPRLRRRIISVMTNDINGTHLPVLPASQDSGQDFFVELMSCPKSFCTPPLPLSQGCGVFLDFVQKGLGLL